MHSLQQRRRHHVSAGPFVSAALAATVGCSGSYAREADTASSTQTLTLGAYTTPREAFGKDILPTFAKQWLASEKKELAFEESYLGSGAQARAIVGGFEADVAALSLEPDLGGWPNVVKQLFAPGAVFDRASAKSASAS